MTRQLRFASLFAGTALALAAPLLIPAQAQACGGTFCDAGPTAMPVDQTGENVIFHIGDNSVQAHIQIQIDPDTPAEAFAWVIPVSAIPEFNVGSQLFFDATLNASVPRYGMSTSTDFCGEDDVGDPNGSGFTTAAGSDGGDEAGETGGEEPPGPEVVYEETVGAFDIVVLDGGTIEGVMQWLADNGYQQDPNAEPILGEYLDEGFLFAAMKLNVAAGVSDVHPIVITYDGTEPCVPIRLTRIAAAEDMNIRTFFFQDGRTVPVNYRHVLVNPLKIDWFNNADNYKEVITMAVDAEGADGNAFVTEYAGTSQIIPTWQFNDPNWNGAPFEALVDSPVGAITELENQGLISCNVNWDIDCAYNHPLLQGVVSQYIPVPDGVDPVMFYDCLECYADQIDLLAWDAAAFAAAIDERIVAPAKQAEALVQNNPYLTRMYTTISPNEMNADPMFRVNNTLDDVPAQRIANQVNHCNGTATVTLPDGREIFFPEQGTTEWPDFQDEMPWEEDVDQENMAENAPLISLVDNTDEINDLLTSHNNQAKAELGQLPSGGCTCSVDGDHREHLLFGLAVLGLCGLARRRRS